MIILIKKIVKNMIAFYYSMPFFKIDNKKIVFDNFNGKGYGCNPKYIAEEIIKQDLGYDMVWLVKDLNTSMPKEIRKVKYGSFQARKELATSKVWIDNVRNFKGVKKKKNQFYIQTWHGSLGIKKVEGEVEKFLSPNYVEEAKNDGKITNLMISNNSVETSIYKNSFWYNGQVLNIGLPRNDILYHYSEGLKRKVYDFFNIDYNKKIVLYAPTYRDNLNIEDITFDFYKCCDILKEKFNSEYVILLRLHPILFQYVNMINYDNVVIDANHYDDIQELLAISEIGITDYSSISFDMSMLEKPVFLICKDLNNYSSCERGLAFANDELPFNYSKTEEELFENIRAFSITDYKNKCKNFYEKIGLINTDHASKDIVEIIKQEMS